MNGKEQLKKAKTTEAGIQKAVIQWARLNRHNEPRLNFLIAIPNGTPTGKHWGAAMVDAGVSRGFPDLFLFAPAKASFGPTLCGLAIELKKPGGKVSMAQRKWILALQNQEYGACVCHSSEQAISQICSYLNRRDLISPPRSRGGS